MKNKSRLNTSSKFLHTLGAEINVIHKHNHTVHRIMLNKLDMTCNAVVKLNHREPQTIQWIAPGFS